MPCDYSQRRSRTHWVVRPRPSRSEKNPSGSVLLAKGKLLGKGLATEAAKAVTGYAFSELDLARIDSAAAYENVASKRVVEKMGMRYLGMDEPGGYSFTLAKDEYSQGKGGESVEKESDL